MPGIFLYRELKFSSDAEELAANEDFELAGYQFEAAPEATRSARVVRVGVIQNAIVKSTSEDVVSQRDALHKRMTTIVEAAALAKVNVLCFQEAWSKLLDVMTRSHLQIFIFSHAIRVLHTRKDKVVRICRVCGGWTDDKVTL